MSAFGTPGSESSTAAKGALILILIIGAIELARGNFHNWLKAILGYNTAGTILPGSSIGTATGSWISNDLNHAKQMATPTLQPSSPKAAPAIPPIGF